MSGHHAPTLAVDPAERLLELAWLQTMGLPTTWDQLPAYADSLEANHWARVKAERETARAFGLCFHCSQPAALWTLERDDSGRMPVPLCERCDDDSWADLSCPDCGCSLTSSRCES